MRTSLNSDTAKVAAQVLSFFGAVPDVVDGVYNNIMVKLKLSTHTKNAQLCGGYLCE